MTSMLLLIAPISLARNTQRTDSACRYSTCCRQLYKKDVLALWLACVHAPHSHAATVREQWTAGALASVGHSAERS